MIIMGIDPGFAIAGYGIVKYEGNKFTSVFTGKVDQGATVWVNGKQVAVDSAGNFTAAVTLNNGTNTLTIEVKNKAGDIIKITKVVTYEETSQPPTPTTSEQLIITLQINNPL